MKEYKGLGVLSAISLLMSVVALVVCIIYTAQLDVANNKVNDVREYAAKKADKNWFDYSYEVIENYDENNIRRFHVTYYYSKVGESGTYEIMVYYKDGKLVSEEI